MEDRLLTNCATKYFNTLKMVGNISSFDMEVLLVLFFLNEYLNLEGVDICKIKELLDCIYKSSCIVNERFDIKKWSNNIGFTYTFNFILS